MTHCYRAVMDVSRGDEWENEARERKKEDGGGSGGGVGGGGEE